MNYWLGVIGTWLVSDGIYSISLYWNAPSYEGSPRQNWKRDHWVRLVRVIAGIVLIIMGI